MTTILAVSVGDRIEQYGAYAGFASVLGLAVLSLLYFAQAREVRRLREWAGRAPERAAELEARVQSQAQGRVVAQPIAPAAPAAPSAAAAATPAGQAGKSAPSGAPATAAAATQIIKPPPATPAGNGVPPKEGESPAAAPDEGAESKPAEGAKAKEGKPDEPAKPGAPAGTPATPESKPAPPAPPAATPAGATTASPATPAGGPAVPPAPAPKPEPAVPLRVSQPTATVPPRSGARPPAPATDGGSGRRILAIVAPAVVVLAFVAFVAFDVLGGDDEPAGPNEIVETVTDGAAPAPGNDDTAAPPADQPVDRGAVTVSVLNGTTVPGLARAVADRLVASKFTELGTVTNAADQTRSATIIEFVSGARDEALEVARVVKVGADAVQPMTEATRVIAGQGADVVVTVGADQNPGQ